MNNISQGHLSLNSESISNSREEVKECEKMVASMKNALSAINEKIHDQEKEQAPLPPPSQPFHTTHSVQNLYAPSFKHNFAAASGGLIGSNSGSQSTMRSSMHLT